MEADADVDQGSAHESGKLELLPNASSRARHTGRPDKPNCQNLEQRKVCAGLSKENK